MYSRQAEELEQIMTMAYDPHADWAREDREFDQAFKAELAKLRSQQESFESIMRAAVRTRYDACQTR